jgi:transposase InsO family protein
MMMTFIDQHRETFGVESICAMLPVAPSTYFRWKAQQREPTQRSPRALRDELLRSAIRRVWDAHFAVYGVRKVWRQLRREGIEVARCTVQRLMRAMGLAGARRGRAWVTTTQPAVAADHPRDLVARNFTANRPNQLWVSDFTYVATWTGFVYVAFVIDVFARRIVGWRVSASLRTDFVLDALKQAIYDRGGHGTTTLRSRGASDQSDSSAAVPSHRHRFVERGRHRRAMTSDHLTDPHLRQASTFQQLDGTPFHRVQHPSSRHGALLLHATQFT